MFYLSQAPSLSSSQPYLFLSSSQPQLSSSLIFFPPLASSVAQRQGPANRRRQAPAGTRVGAGEALPTHEARLRRGLMRAAEPHRAARRRLPWAGPSCRRHVMTSAGGCLASRHRRAQQAQGAGTPAAMGRRGQDWRRTSALLVIFFVCESLCDVNQSILDL